MSALDTQVGGEHYRAGTIQPVQFIESNKLAFLEGCVVKRVTRHDKPTGKGRQDIEKAIHELQLLLELRYGSPRSVTIPENVFRKGDIVKHEDGSFGKVREVDGDYVLCDFTIRNGADVSHKGHYSQLSLYVPGEVIPL